MSAVPTHAKALEDSAIASQSDNVQDGWHWAKLGDYAENHDGRRIPVSKKDRESRTGQFPYYGASGVIDTIDGYTHDGEFVLIGEDGAVSAVAGGDHAVKHVHALRYRFE